MGSKNILGVNMLKIADDKPEVLADCLAKVVELHSAGSIVPQIGGSFPVGEIAKAHDDLEIGKTTGKIVIHW